MRKLLTALVASALALSALSAKEGDLAEAYQKEFAFLKAQKRSLEGRLGEVKKHNSGNIAKAKQQIDRLQAKLLRLDNDAEKAEQQLSVAERDAQDVKDNSQVVEGTLLQAKTTLEPFGLKLDEKAKKGADEMKKAFAFAAAQVSRLGGVQKEKGSFFLLDVSKADGEIIRVGNIASYGISGDNAVALVPAGDGKFKAWNQPASDSAKALANGEKPERLAMFIYESSEKEVDTIKEKSAIDVINSGGAIGWVIVGLGGVALALVILRALFLRRADSNTTIIRAKVVGELLENGTEAALKTAKQSKGAAARVLTATIRNIEREREHLEDIVAEAVLHENSFLDRFGSAIMVIAAVAPLLGLLGTVTGMISTFDVITEFGTGDPKMLSGGISEALVTTELGLIVAIPALLLGNLLSGWAERIKDYMEQAALHVTNAYIQSKIR